MTERFEATLRSTLLPVELDPADRDAEPFAAVVVLLRRGDRGPEVLLVERAEREGDPWSGQIALPGGGHRDEDGTMFRTALRETKEEVGVDLDEHAEVLGRLPPRAPGNMPDRLVVPYVAVARTPVDPVTGPEISSAFWCRLADLPATRTHSVVATSFGDLTVPAFEQEGHLIWGFTYRILEELLGILGTDAGRA